MKEGNRTGKNEQGQDTDTILLSPKFHRGMEA